MSQHDRRQRPAGSGSRAEQDPLTVTIFPLKSPLECHETFAECVRKGRPNPSTCIDGMSQRPRATVTLFATSLAVLDPLGFGFRHGTEPPSSRELGRRPVVVRLHPGREALPTKSRLAAPRCGRFGAVDRSLRLARAHLPCGKPPLHAEPQSKALQRALSILSLASLLHG